MKKLLALAAFLLPFAVWCDTGFAWTHGATPTGLPVIVAGTLVPTAQTPLMPAATTWAPSCGGSGNTAQDGAWGAGCTVATGLCDTLSGGNPQSCMPPQMLFPTGGTGNGTTATINYTSYAHYSYTVGTPLLIKNATQANWNTTAIPVTSFATGGTNPNYTVTLGCQTTCANLASGQTIYVSQVTSGSVSSNDMPGTGWTTGNPNGAWTLGASCCNAGSVTFNTGTTSVTGTLGGLVYQGGTTGLNNLNYNGTIQRPWNITASVCNIGGVAEHCSVSFTNPNSCASSCVSASTQIIAGQNDNLVLDWHFGETIPNSVQNTDVQVCVDAKHISPIQYIAISVDGGAWTTLTTTINDPWGAGQSGTSATVVKVYCAHYVPSASHDGLHEVRATGCATVGYCGHLTSQIAVDCTHASTYCKANNHELQAFKLVGVTKSNDAQFQNYDSRLSTAQIGTPISSNNLSVTGRSAGGGGLAGDTFTLTYTQPANVSPFVAGQTVAVTGITTNSCTGTVTGGTATGAALTLTYSGGCNFPAGSEVSIASAVPGSAAVASGTYNSVAGTYALTFASAPFGAAPTTGGGISANIDQYNVTGLTGTAPILTLGSLVGGSGTNGTYPGASLTGGTGSGATANITVAGGTVTSVTLVNGGTGYTLGDTLSASVGSLSGFSIKVATNNISNLNGLHVLTSSSGSGTVLTFTDTTGYGTITLTGGTVSGNGLAFSSLTNTGTVVSSTNGSSSITVPSISTGTVTVAGTITGNWNGNCVAQSGTGTGQLVCPQPYNTETTATGGVITATGNLYCIATGAGDWPAPYDPALDTQARYQGNPDAIQLIAYNGQNNCTGTQQQTGCAVTNCGLLPSTTETIWVARKDEGFDERASLGNSVMNLHVNGALFIYTNAGGTLKGQDAYVDSWQSSNGASTCVGAVRATANYGANLPTFAASGAATKCNDLRHAAQALLPNAGYTGSGTTTNQAVAVDGTTGCTTFTNSLNTGGTVPFFVGEPVVFTGLDTTAAGTDGNGNATPAFSYWGVYWITAISGTSISLAPTRTAGCIKEAATAIYGGNTSAQSVAGLNADFGMDSLLLVCDTGAGCSTSNPQTYTSMATTTGGTTSYFAKTGYFNIDPDRSDGTTALNTSLIIGPNGYFSANISQSGHIRNGVSSIQGQLALSLASGTSIGPTPLTQTVTGTPAVSGTTETLNFAALSGVAWQVPTGTGSPGQGIIVSGLQGPSCSITSGTGNGTTTSISYTGACSFSAGNTATVASSSSTVVNNASPFVLTAASAGSISFASTFSGTLTATGTISDQSWNCGTPAAPCHVASASSTQITFTNTNPTATFPGTAANGRILPASVIAEFAAGTLAYNSSTNTHGDCADVNNVATNTGAALACWAAYTTPSTYIPGTNGTAFPLYGIGSNPATVLATTANCLPVNAGQSTTSDISTYILKSTPAGAGGTTNDILELTTTAAASQGVVAANQCRSTLSFENTAFSFGQIGGGNPLGASLVWFDGVQTSGPSWYAPIGTTSNITGGTKVGAGFLTNSSFYNSRNSLDGATYVWGSITKYNYGICINTDLIVVSSQCYGDGGFGVPVTDPANGNFLGGNSISGTGTVNNVYWVPVVGSLTGVGGSNVQCSGVNCVNSTSRVIEVAQGTLPDTVQPGNLLYVVCNMDNPLTGGSFTSYSGAVITGYNNVANPSWVSVASGGSTCTTGQNMQMMVYNATHIDMIFWSFNTSPAPITGGSPWLIVNDTIHDNFQSNGLVNMQGFYNGGGTYYDMAFDNDTIWTANTNFPGGTAAFKGVDFSGGDGYTNIMFRNSTVYGPVLWLFDAPAQNNSDIYFLNDVAGTWLNFPTAQQYSAIYTAFGDASRAINNPPTNAPGGGGTSEVMTVWPTLTVTVDPSGNPTGGGVPGASSLQACPWVGGASGCLTGDPGNGSM